MRYAWSLRNSNANENKVLLYNFFEDSKATLSQWRLVLNEVERMDRGCEAPMFDETRHASICSEVSCALFMTPILTVLLQLVVEVPLRCDYSSEEESLDNGHL